MVINELKEVLRNLKTASEVPQRALEAVYEHRRQRSIVEEIRQLIVERLEGNASVETGRLRPQLKICQTVRLSERSVVEAHGFDYYKQTMSKIQPRESLQLFINRTDGSYPQRQTRQSEQDTRLSQSFPKQNPRKHTPINENSVLGQMIREFKEAVTPDCLKQVEGTNDGCEKSRRRNDLAPGPINEGPRA